MNHFKTIFILLMLSMVLGFKACNNPSESSQQEIEKSELISNVPITLKAGERYIVNRATQDEIKNMIAILEEGIESDNPNMANIASSLEKSMKEIYASNTSEGDSFEALDAYLIKAKDYVHDIENAANKIILIELHAYLNQFTKYFK